MATTQRRFDEPVDALEYENEDDHLDEAWCARCHQWKPAGEMHGDWCQTCYYVWWRRVMLDRHRFLGGCRRARYED